MSHECTECGETFEQFQGLSGHKRWNHNHPWQDKETLREEYVEKNKSVRELAAEWGCGDSTISKWAREFGLEKKHKDPEILTELYLDKGMSIREVADALNCGDSTISRKLDEFGIESREKGQSNADSIADYSLIQCEGVSRTVRVHRLVAYAHGILDGEEFFDKDTVVHHKNGISWLDNPENLEKTTPEEHGKTHTSNPCFPFQSVD